MSTISEKFPSSNTLKTRIFPMKNLFSFYIKNLPTSKFIKIANFFLKGARNFLTPDLKSTIKSSSIKRGQISKNVELSTSYSPLKTQETIFKVTLPARVKPQFSKIREENRKSSSGPKLENLLWISSF